MVLAFFIGYLDDILGPQSYHYKNQIVVVDKNYQCPKYCEVHHNHSVYFEYQSIGMVVVKDELGVKYKEPKKKRRR